MALVKVIDFQGGGKFGLFKLAIAASVLAASSYVKVPAQAATVWDVATDFSTANNPIGVWSYGSTSTLGGIFIPHSTTALKTGVIDVWQDPLDPPLSVFHNGTASLVTTSSGQFQLGQFGFHPGLNGE